MIKHVEIVCNSYVKGDEKYKRSNIYTIKIKHTTSSPGITKAGT